MALAQQQLSGLAKAREGQRVLGQVRAVLLWEALLGTRVSVACPPAGHANVTFARLCVTGDPLYRAAILHQSACSSDAGQGLGVIQAEVVLAALKRCWPSAVGAP